MKSSGVISKVAAVILILFGLSALAASLSNISLIPHFFRITIDASLQFLIAGIIILFYPRKNIILQRILTVLYFTVFFYSLVLIIRDLYSGNDLAGIAPVALLLFLFTGLAFVFLASIDSAYRNAFIAGVLGLVVSTAGLFSLADFPWLTSEGETYNTDSVVINASILFTILGMGIFSLTLEVIKLKWSLKANLTAGLAAGLAIMIAMSILSHISVANLRKNAAQVANTREVEYHLSRISSLLLQLDLQRQNYLLTGIEQHKNLTDSAFSEILSELSVFKRLTADKKSQQERAKKLNTLFSARKGLLEKTFQEYELKGNEVVSNLLFLQERTELINDISALLEEADKEEKIILALHEKETDEATRNTFIIVPFGDVASLAILVWIFMLLNNEVTDRIQSEVALKESEEKLRNTNAELKQKEEQLSNLNESLTRSNQELAQFAYVASHDLQEPLRMVASYTQLIEKRYKDKLDQDANDFINYAVDGANRMQKLINDLLEYSRVSTRGRPLAEVDLSYVLGLAIANLQNKIQETGSIVAVDNDLPCIMGDEMQIMRVFQNLIDNAIKFRGTETPRIFVKSRHENNKIIISIKDNGIGIDKKYSDRIFVIFQRLHSSSLYPGTGIGLTICKRIIERHGGKIWLESEPGKGTTFSFSLTYR